MNGGALPGTRRPRSVTEDIAAKGNCRYRDAHHSYQTVRFILSRHAPLTEIRLHSVNVIAPPQHDAGSGGDTLSPYGRRLRLAATLIGAVLLLAGTLIGTDDDFPFGPFSMYASAQKLNAPVADTRIEAVDTRGRRWTLTQTDTGIRRAEIEGQLDRFVAEPARLAAVASAYERRNPDAPPLTTIAVVVRWHEVHDGRPTGHYHDQTRVVWHP